MCATLMLASKPSNPQNNQPIDQPLPRCAFASYPTHPHPRPHPTQVLDDSTKEAVRKKVDDAAALSIESGHPVQVRPAARHPSSRPVPATAHAPRQTDRQADRPTHAPGCYA